jgi:hypothetical protein
MSQFQGTMDDFGMDAISLAGPLEAKLKAIAMQVWTSRAQHAMWSGTPTVWSRRAVHQGSRLRVTGFQVLRDFEGLSGRLHDYEIDVAKSMLKMCAALGSKVLSVVHLDPCHPKTLTTAVRC